MIENSTAAGAARRANFVGATWKCAAGASPGLALNWFLLRRARFEASDRHGAGIHAARMMLAVYIGARQERARFGQVILPKPGSVVASPVLAAYDPDPDYFFHWYRDSALVMDALRLLRGELPKADGMFRDFVHFSLDLHELDGNALPPDWRDRAQPDFVRFLRKDVSDAHGAAVPAESRINPDGSLDITDWPRPQNDGPALRALCVLRWGAEGSAAELLRRDLAFVLRHAWQPCFDIWEEERGLHAYTLRVSAAALAEGAD